MNIISFITVSLPWLWPLTHRDWSLVCCLQSRTHFKQTWGPSDLQESVQSHTVLWFLSHMSVSVFCVLPVFPSSHIIVSDAIFAHQPNAAFYGPQWASETCCVDVGSGSEGSTGFKINRPMLSWCFYWRGRLLLTLSLFLQYSKTPQSDLAFHFWTPIIWTFCPTSKAWWHLDWFWSHFLWMLWIPQDDS